MLKYKIPQIVTLIQCFSYVSVEKEKTLANF